MAVNTHTGAETGSLAELVSGIGHDLQELVKQQVRLVKAEATDALKKARQGSAILALGVGLLALGGILLTLGLVYLLNWLAPELHVWGSFLIVAAAVGLLGAILFFVGWHQLSSMHRLEQSAESLQENLEWKTQTSPK
jgi:hypothetical protein